MKLIPIFVFISVIALSQFFFAGTAYSEVYTANEQHIFADTLSKCPVTGDDITGEHISFRYADKTIKFCNEGCVMAFKKEPAKFTEHLLCMPCSDPDGKKDISTVHNGVKYYFCSGGCLEKFTANPGKYLNEFKGNK